MTKMGEDNKVLTCICEGCGVELEYMFTGTKYDTNGVQLIDHPLEDGLCYQCIKMTRLSLSTD